MNALHELIKNKQHVIWDWNGTLLNDLDHAIDTVNELLQRYGLPKTNLSEYRKKFGFPVVDYYRHLGFDVSPERFKEQCEIFNDLFHRGLNKCDLWPGARELLHSIKLSGKVQSLLSASQHDFLHQSVDLFQIRKHFDHIFGVADKQAASKVARGHELMAHVKIDADHTVLIGDTDHDLEVGDALGVDVILVEHGHQCPTRLKAVHHRVVKVL